MVFPKVWSPIIFDPLNLQVLQIIWSKTILKRLEVLLLVPTYMKLLIVVWAFCLEHLLYGQDDPGALPQPPQLTCSKMPPNH